jgi:SAM-dependent methyltransferase
LLYPDLNFIELRAKFGKARALSYEEKYADRSEMADERYVDFGSWEAEFRRLLFQLGLSGQLPRMKAINVGIGNGNERPSDYSAFAELTGIDVSEEALQKAKRYLPKMQTIAAEAEDLAVIPSNSQDLYVSLRTYQSSFFGIKAALFEAFRVLRPGGSIIISISNAYVESDQVLRGLQRPGSSELDLDRPYDLANTVRKGLTYLNFEAVGIQTGSFEVYVYGRKNLRLSAP